MTREGLDWLCRLRSEIYVYMPKEWLIPMNNDMAISALSVEGEYIKKSEALSKAEYYETGLTTGFEYVTTKDLNSLPTYSFPDSAENKGEWMLKVDSYYEDGSARESHWECSNCGSGRSGWGEFKVCPDCGADMREPKTNDLSKTFLGVNSFSEVDKEEMKSWVIYPKGEKKGEWIYQGDEISGELKCSACGKTVDVDGEDFRFCPYCGSVMNLKG